MAIGTIGNLFSCLTSIVILISPFSAFALPKTSRTVCGEILGIDNSKHSIDFFVYEKSEPMNVRIINRTSLFQDGDSVPFESLVKGIPVELVYKTPFFGERFAVKLRWALKGVLNSYVCVMREGGK